MKVRVETKGFRIDSLSFMVVWGRTEKYLSVSSANCIFYNSNGSLIYQFAYCNFLGPNFAIWRSKKKWPDGVAITIFV